MNPTSTAVDRITHGPLHLDVVDRERSLAFWRDVVGLGVRPGDDGEAGVALGTDTTLLVLHPGAARGVQPGHAGLYHLALHVPHMTEFARTVARFAAHRVPQAPTDHIFSMATYVTDPDGITLEVTLETPERMTGFHIGARSIVLTDREGRRRGPTEALDLEPVMAALGDADVMAPIDPHTRVGHIHLHVPRLADAVAFYRDRIGFDEHMVMDAIGMADLSAGGRFPHRLALNTWHGPHAVQPPAGTSGMRLATLRVGDASDLEEVSARLAHGGLPHTVGADGVRTTDPAGNPLLLTTAG